MKSELLRMKDGDSEFTRELGPLPPCIRSPPPGVHVPTGLRPALFSLGSSQDVSVRGSAFEGKVSPLKLTPPIPHLPR